MKYTKFPNLLLDSQAEFSPSEWKIITVIVRQTIGFSKTWDKISLTQFQRKTKLSRQTVITAKESLEHGGWINTRQGKHKGKAITEYRISDSLVKNLDYTGLNFRLSTGLNFRHTKENYTKENLQKKIGPGTLRVESTRRLGF